MGTLEPVIFPKHQAEEREHGNPIPNLTTSWPCSCQHVSILSPLSHAGFTLSGLSSIVPSLTF